jgi:hypothetical protein
MGNLAQVIKNDFQLVGKVLKGTAIGTFRGIYTPALMNTGTKQFIDDVKSNEPFTEFVAKGTTQIASACLIHIPLSVLAIEQGKLEYFGMLATTNTIDYLVHAYKRSKA